MNYAAINRRRQWQPTPVLLPGKSHGRRSLVGCSPWCCKESDTTERLLSLFFSQLFVRPPQTANFLFCISFPWGWSWSLSPAQCREPHSIVHQAVFLPGESQGWRSLVGCHLWGRTGSDTAYLVYLKGKQRNWVLGRETVICKCSKYEQKQVSNSQSKNQREQEARKDWDHEKEREGKKSNRDT